MVFWFVIYQIPREEIAMMYRIPTFKSDTTQPSEKGMTAQADNATKQVIIGARIKIALFAS